MDEEYEIPEEVINGWIEDCNCCPMCFQDIPCGGVQAGGMCDNMCQCDELNGDTE